jgi:FkbM family methyltransferase
MKSLIISLEQKLSGAYISINRPFLPITRLIREPLRWFYHRSPYLRHDSKIYLRPFLLNRIHSLFVAEHPHDFRIYNNQIKFRSFGSALSEQAYYVGEVEYHLIQYLVKQICDDFTMIDIGAHHGAYTLIAAYELRKRGLKGKIYSFEPDPSNFSLLAYNVEQNELSEYVVLHEMAVGEVNGKENFCIDDDNSGNSLKSALDELTADGDLKYSSIQLVDVVKLDDFAENLFHINLIKLDIQGGEPYALRGARDTLIKHQPILLIEAVPQWKTTKMSKEILDEYNYQISGIDKNGQTCEPNSKKAFVSWDWLAFPSSHRN